MWQALTGSRKYFVAGLITVAVVAYFIYRFSVEKDAQYETATVTRTSIIQQASASGNVESPTTIDLQFENGGRLTYLGVRTGEEVKAGQRLATLDSSVLAAQLQQANAAVAAQKAQLESLQEGTRPEQLAVLRSQVSTDETSLEQANAALVDVIQTAYTQSDDAIRNKVDQFFINPRTPNPKITFTASDAQLQASLELDRVTVENLLSKWHASVTLLTPDSDLAAASTDAQKVLATVGTLLIDANGTLNGAIANQQASATTLASYITSVATARGNVNAASTALTTAITTQKAARAALEKDNKSLALAEAGSTASTISAQEALVAQAQANVAAIQAQIAQLSLVAPVDGTVTITNGSVGETILPTEIVVSMLPQEKLQISVNLSEDNVGAVAAGQPVLITLDAFPGQTWHGTVTKIDPAQTVIGGAVYYRTTIAFESEGTNVRPGMTADVLIQTGVASSTLVVPASALQQTASGPSVQVFEGGDVRIVPIATGLMGRDGMIEVLSGISEGQLVVTRTH